MMQTKDIQYWNIVKGIGIVLVVLGHSGLPCTNYIYLFHLPLFFFVSGFLYNEEKYGDNPYLNVAARVKSSWIKCVFLYWILILLHNTFFEYRIWDVGTTLYSKEEILIKLSEALFCNAHEVLGGTLWFVPVVVIASCLLGFIVTISRSIGRITNSLRVKYFVQACLIVLCGICGYFLQLYRVEMMVHMQVVLVVMPFLWSGYLLRNSGLLFEKYLNPIVAVIFGIIIYIVSLYNQLELVFMIVYPYMHLVAFLGIYMCMYIAKLIQCFRACGRVFEWLGKASFWIMFVHFPNFLLFDWIYTKIVYPNNHEKYLQIKVSYPELWPIYLMIGIALPLIEYVTYTKIKEFICSKIIKRK